MIFVTVQECKATYFSKGFFNAVCKEKLLSETLNKNNEIKFFLESMHYNETQLFEGSY